MAGLMQGIVMKRLLWLAIASLSSSAHASGSVVIDFDRLPQSDTEYYLTVSSPYYEDGFVVELIPQVSCNFSTLEFQYPTVKNIWAYPGSPALFVPIRWDYWEQCDDPSGQPFTVGITRVDGDVFDLRSIDFLCHAQNCWEGTLVKGVTPAGRVASQLCEVRTMDTATCVFDSTFQGIERIEWEEGGRAIEVMFDNIHIGGASGVPTPWIKVSPQSILFPQVAAGGSGSAAVTVSNVGQADLLINEVAISNDLAAPFSLGNSKCQNAILGPEQSCEFEIHFAPLTPGSFSDSFSISSNDPYMPLATIQVRGDAMLVGGSTSGLRHVWVECENKTQKVKKIYPFVEDELGHWDCQAAGLPVQSGDDVRMYIRGEAR